MITKIKKFRTEYDNIKEKQDEKWRIQRCTLILEYKDKEFLPMPFRLFYNIYLMVVYLKDNVRGTGETKRIFN